MMQKAGRKPQSDERKKLFGKRMRLAAEQAGLMTQSEVGEQLGINQATVSRWWNGQQLPAMDELARYAELVGKRLWWFYMEAGDDEFAGVADLLMEIVSLTMLGRDLVEAYNQVTGDVHRFGARERAALAAGTEPLRRRITRETDGDWEGHPDRQRRAVLDRLAAEALQPEE